MTATATPTVAPPGPTSLPARTTRSISRGLDAVGRNSTVCIVAGVIVLALASWYVTWHVPTSHWLLASRYAIGFEDLYYRIVDIRRVQAGGTLYSPQDHLQYFVYPPAAAWLFWPLTWVDRFVGELAWTFASLLSLAAMIAAAARFACHWTWAKAWAVSLLVATPLAALILQPVDVHLALGQVGLFLAVATTVDILCVRNRARGFLTGVAAALKIYPIVYVAIFVLRREWRAVWTAAAGLVATTALAWIAFPSDSATFFFHRLLSGRELHHYWHNTHWISSSSSVYTVFFRMPFTGSGPERVLAFATCVVVIGFGILAARRQTIERREVGAYLCVALASTIGSPVSWDHYFIWVVLVPFVFAERGEVGWPRTAALWLFVATCLVPLRIARNESLFFTSYDWHFYVIFIGRNALTIASLAWLVTAWLRVPSRSRAVQESAVTSSSHHARIAG